MTAQPQIAALDQIEAQARALIEAQGPDVVRFLQGLLSQDVNEIAAGEGRAAALLTVKGKIVWDAVVLRRDEGHFVLAVPADLVDAALEKLDRHLIMDEVTLRRSDAKLALAWGNATPASAAGLESFSVDYPLEGHLLVGSAEAIEALGASATSEAFHATRIAQGVPAWGFEVVPDRFPPEVGFVRSVSYDKGCFMGQEPLARIHARGKTNWVMVRVEALGAFAVTLAPGEGLGLSSDSRVDGGHLTSFGATDGGGRGLAVLHRSLAVEGTVLRASDDRQFEVCSEPLGDDPGMGGRGKGPAPLRLGGR